MNEIDALAESQLNDAHYLRSVTQLGDSRPIVANREINTSSGMKLVNAGMRIDSSLYERLLQHKLAPPLDQCLVTEDVVTGTSLMKKAEQMLDEDKRLALIQNAQLDGQTLPQILKQVPLAPPIAFKLTIMRETNEVLFRHSIYVALVSIYIGMQLQLDKDRLVDVASAALLHDIGILHIDPKLLERGHKLSDTERRHLYAHSVTGWMILSAYPEYKKRILDAVLQHHERLDGSGYPRGLRSADIGQIGQIIAVAEIIASRFGSEDVDFSWSRLETILKLNLRRYGSDLVRYLNVFYQEEAEQPACAEIDKQGMREKMLRISRIFAAWENKQDIVDGKDPVCTFINERMTNLKVEVIDTGLSLYESDKNLLVIQEDSRACFDARLLMDETLWQLRNIIREIRRRWPSIETGSPESSLREVSVWIKEVEALL